MIKKVKKEPYSNANGQSRPLMPAGNPLDFKDYTP